MRLNEAETEKFNIKQMKDMFEQKAAQLATEIVGKIGRKALAFFINAELIINKGFVIISKKDILEKIKVLVILNLCQNVPFWTFQFCFLYCFGCLCKHHTFC